MPSFQNERLLTTCSIGRTRLAEPKRIFFLHHGFTMEQWQLLAARLLHHALENEVVTSDENPHGVRYAVDGPLITPVGKSLNVRTAWFIDHGSETPRFITAYPLPKS